MYPSDLRYTDEHEWVRAKNGICVVGITSFAAEQLGEVTYVELPETGSLFTSGDDAGVVESVKAASDIYSPVGGTVSDINATLENRPELVNESPFGDGWFFKLERFDQEEVDALMDASAYEIFVSELEH